MCNKEKFWRQLCVEVDRLQWREDARFSSYAARLKNRDLLTQLLDVALSERTTGEWLVRLQGRVPAAPVLDVQQALENPFVTDEGRIQAIPLSGRPAVKVLRAPVRCAQSPPPPSLAPGLGQDTEAVLQAVW